VTDLRDGILESEEEHIDWLLGWLPWVIEPGAPSGHPFAREKSMARHTGPRLRVMRGLGTELPGLCRKPIGERDYPAGQHGARRGSRVSAFAVKLIEKQKLRFNYGLTERQLRNLFLQAKVGKGPAGDGLLLLLERQLDNAVFRAGFAPTGISARQLVRHRHVVEFYSNRT
jgi:small subunit ribosomal protein S4